MKSDSGYHFYIYTDKFFYKIGEPSKGNHIQVDEELNSIVFIFKYANMYEDYFNRLMRVFFLSWDAYFFKKIKFTGKGYRVTYRKRKKFIKFHFGRSHPTIVIFRSIILKKPHKYKFVIANNNINKVWLLNTVITNIKPINLYTKRGLRCSRQMVYKRKSNKTTF